MATENYTPVKARWTSERCAICRWVEDWEYNKIIICNRYAGIYNFYLSRLCFFVVWNCKLVLLKVSNCCTSRMLWSNECPKFFFVGLSSMWNTWNCAGLLPLSCQRQVFSLFNISLKFAWGILLIWLWIWVFSFFNFFCRRCSEANWYWWPMGSCYMCLVSSWSCIFRSWENGTSSWYS